MKVIEYLFIAFSLWLAGYITTIMERGIIVFQGKGNYVKVPLWLYIFCGSPQYNSTYKYIVPRKSIWPQLIACIMLIYLFFSYIFNFHIDLRLGLFLGGILGAIITCLLPKY
jgi:hypothetical protein